MIVNIDYFSKLRIDIFQLPARCPVDTANTVYLKMNYPLAETHFSPCVPILIIGIISPLITFLISQFQSIQCYKYSLSSVWFLEVFEEKTCVEPSSVSSLKSLPISHCQFHSHFSSSGLYHLPFVILQ